MTPELLGHTPSLHGRLKLHRALKIGGSDHPATGVQTAQERALGGNGPALAISYLRLVATTKAPKPPPRRRGARNRADRESHCLTAGQIEKLLAACEHATLIGLPLTRMQTIHWGHAGVPLNRMAWATGRYIDLLTKGLARQGCRTAWMWTHENGQWQGHHCHLLAHIPAALVPFVVDHQRGWIRAITQTRYVTHTIRSRPVGWRLGLEVSNPELHAANLTKAAGYLVKQASPEAVAKFDLDTVQPGGLVIGKRYGISQRLGPLARKGGA